MTVGKHIQWMRSLYEGFNGAADPQELVAFSVSLGGLPESVLELYRDHDGSPSLPVSGEYVLPVRLMPMPESRETAESFEEIDELASPLGRLAWLWTDDNSNYVGVFTTGRLAGWLVKLLHDEPKLTPAYRSVASFLTQLLASSSAEAPPEEAANDLYSLPQDLPVTEDNSRYVETDRELARYFAELAFAETDVDMRRQYAECSICLTPAADTGEVVRFFHENDMWTPGTAVRLLELRNFLGAVPELERLAQEGSPNGDSAAMRMLAQSDDPASQRAVARLQAELTGRKLATLEQWLRIRDRSRS